MVIADCMKWYTIMYCILLGWLGLCRIFIVQALSVFCKCVCWLVTKLWQCKKWFQYCSTHGISCSGVQMNGKECSTVIPWYDSVSHKNASLTVKCSNSDNKMLQFHCLISSSLYCTNITHCYQMKNLQSVRTSILPLPCLISMNFPWYFVSYSCLTQDLVVG